MFLRDKPGDRTVRIFPEGLPMRLDDLREGAELGVLVVGASAPGLFAAAQLGRFGLGSVVIDSVPGPGTFSPAMILQARSLELLRTLNLADLVISQGRKLTRVEIINQGKVLANLPMAGLPSPYPFTLSIPQAVLESVLSSHLRDRNIPVFYGVRVISLSQAPGIPGVDLGLSLPGGKVVRVRARQVIACDQSTSRVRMLSGISFPGKEMPYRLVSLDTRLQAGGEDLPFDANQLHLHPDGLLSIHPMAENGYFRIVLERSPSPSELAGQKPGQTRHPFPLPPLELLESIVRDRLKKDRLKFVGEVVGREVACHSRLATRMQLGHVFLAGDAAHIHTPLGGMGMNVALLDVFNLAWKLALVEKGTGWPKILESYHQERHPVVKDLMERCANLESCAPGLQGLANVLCDGLQRFLPSLQAIEEQGALRFSRLGVEYRHSPLVKESQESWLEAIFSRGAGGVGLKAWREFRRGLHAGDRVPALPWPDFAGAKPNYPQTTLDLMKDGLHHALIFAGPKANPDKLERAAQVARAIQTRGPGIGQVVCHLVTDPASGSIPPGLADGLDLVEDRDNHLAMDFGYSSDGLCVIRPDGHLGFHGQPAEFGPIQEWLAGMFTI